MNNDLSWLGKKEELEFLKQKFNGNVALKKHQYSNCIDEMVKIRLMLFVMSIIVFYPVVINYVVTKEFQLDFFIERLTFAVLFFVAGLLFNKYRVLAIIMGMIVIGLILFGNLFSQGLYLRSLVFNLFILGVLIGGLYYHYKLKGLKTDLMKNLLENQLIDD